jgi:hypothetical protein
MGKYAALCKHLWVFFVDRNPREWKVFLIDRGEIRRNR